MDSILDLTQYSSEDLAAIAQECAEEIERRKAEDEASEERPED